MFSFFFIKLEFEWFSLIALIFYPFDSFNQIQPEAVKHCKFSDQVQKLLIIKNHDVNPAKVDLNQFHILLIAFSVTCCIPVNACAALQCKVHRRGAARILQKCILNQCSFNADLLQPISLQDKQCILCAVPKYHRFYVLEDVFYSVLVLGRHC